MSSIPPRPSLSDLAAEPWDLLVIGGGITGAGIMREAARRGVRVLLVEQNDFASGTSSRSAKLIHGGLDYVTRFQLRLAFHSVRERERLVRDGQGLVDPLTFVLPIFAGDRMPDWLVRIGLGLYEAFAGRLQLPSPIPPDAVTCYGGRHPTDLVSAFAYADAQADDARLVLRVLRHGRELGGHALNRVVVVELMRDRRGQVIGAVVHERETDTAYEIRARALVNATGPWADGLRRQVGRGPRLRLVRGSHLVFPSARLCLGHAIAVRHPDSGHALYVIPWEGVTLVGTTNVDHDEPLDDEPRANPDEIDYLLRGVQGLFPALGLELSDVCAAFSGLRPIVDTSTREAAKASRNFAIWEEDGLLTVTGGKLTTFRPMALQALRRLRQRVPMYAVAGHSHPVLDILAPIVADGPFSSVAALRLLARYGAAGLAAIAAASPEERAPIPGTAWCWAELRWAAQAEDVFHLDDLLLRRIRLGLTAPDGGCYYLDRIRSIVQCELGWDDARWHTEVARYTQLWQHSYAPPGARWPMS